MQKLVSGLSLGRGERNRLFSTVLLGLVAVLGFLSSPLCGQIAPLVKIQLPSQVLIGETFTFQVEVSPHPALTDYGPFLEVYLPYQGADCTAASERCDGISFVKAEAVFAVTRVPISPCPAGPQPFVLGSFCSPQQCPGSTATPPTSCFFGLPLPLCLQYPLPPPTGYQKVVLELPIGSFVTQQAPILVEITARVDSYADLGLPSIYVRGGFQFGTSATGGAPTADLQCPMEGGALNPTVATVKKSYLGPESETATGPNFPRQYRITVDIADGQTLNPLKIFDCLPDNMRFAQADTTSLPADCSISSLFNSPVCPRTGFEIECPSVTGTASPVDLEMSFQFFIPETDFDGQPVLGSSCTAESVDDVKLIGDWFPLDPRDPPPVPFTIDDTPADHTLTSRCLAIQKKWDFKPGFDTGALGPTPGDTIVYTLDFQVSDFRTLRDLVVEDYLSDGQSIVPGSARIEIHDKFAAVTGLFTPADLQISPFPGTYECSDGSRMDDPQLLHFSISQRLASLHPSEPRHAQGILTGGLAGLPGGGATTGRITFEARIDDEFQRQDSGLESFVDKDDPLRNCVEIRGDVLANANAPAVPSQVMGPASDDSLQSFAIVPGILKKSVYAINGSTSFPKPAKVNPGDLVTFRIEYPIPSGDAEDFFFEDYLPLPVFRVNQLKLQACLAPPPPAETVTVTGPLCSGPLAFATSPPGGGPVNSFKLSFGDLNDPANAPAAADIYVTTRVTTDPFADGLVLSNHVRQHEQNTFGESFEQTEIAPVIVREPKLRIRKGVVSSNKPTAVFSPQPPVPQGVTFAKPGTTGPAFTGTLTSTNVGAALNSDLSRVDGCDFVKFAIVIENLGTSTKGAFDVRISDVLPACLKNPSNFRIVNGKGKPYTCNKGKNCATLLSSFLGAAGITLDDGAATGALAPFSPASGGNLAIITFDAQVPCDAKPTGCCNNVAKLTGYAGIEGGPNHTQASFSTPFPDLQKPFEDNAQVCVRPGLKKSILATSEAATGSAGGIAHLAIGEIVRYCLEVTLPEGVSPQMVLSDKLPAGLEWLPGTACTVGVRDPKPQQPPCAFGPKDPKIVFGVANPKPVLQGGNLTLNFGTVKNNHNDPADETLAVQCNALVRNVPANVQPGAKPNSFTVKLTPPGGQAVTFASNTVLADVVEPLGDLKKEEAPVCLPGGARYLLSSTNTGTAPAFDVRLRDTLPPGVTVSGPLVLNPATCTVASAGPSVVDVACPVLAPGTPLTLQLDVTGIQTCQSFKNQARLDRSSLPGLKGTFPNPTGSQTPGASGAPKGERIYTSLADLVTHHCADLAIDLAYQATDHDFDGSIITLQVTVENVGTSPSLPPTQVDNLINHGGGGSLTFLSGGGNGWTCATGVDPQFPNFPHEICTTNTPIPPGVSSTFTIRYEVEARPAGIFSMSASVTGCEDVNQDNNGKGVSIF